MDAAYEALIAALEQEFQRLNIDRTAFHGLTLQQVAAIRRILMSDADEAAMRSEVEAVLEEGRTGLRPS